MKKSDLPTIVLFTQAKSNYEGFHTELYDLNKDARTYKDSRPVIAHPPCGSWGRLRKLCMHSNEVHQLAILAATIVRQNKGILEHPAGSTLWKELNLPYPGEPMDSYGGFTLSIDQHWFGHKAKKNTWLYIVGSDPRSIPPYPLNFSPVTHSISSSKRNLTRQVRLKELSKKARSATPVKLCEWLITLVKSLE